MAAETCRQAKIVEKCLSVMSSRRQCIDPTLSQCQILSC